MSGTSLGHHAQHQRPGERRRRGVEFEAVNLRPEAAAERLGRDSEGQLGLSHGGKGGEQWFRDVDGVGHTVTVNTVTVICVNIGYHRVMDGTFSIDELAARSGVPSRTIRQYQTEGVLPRPERDGRVGVYRVSHVERLEAIARLQERGYSLAGMRDLFDAHARGRDLHQIIGTASVSSGFDEAPILLTHEQLTRAVPALGSAKLRSAAVSSGLVAARPKPDGGWFVRSPSALAMVGDLIDAGIGGMAAVALHATLRGALEQAGGAIAKALGRIESSPDRIDLLLRNRAVLGRAAATLLTDAIGRALPPGDADHLRVGAVLDSRPTPSAVH